MSTIWCKICISPLAHWRGGQGVRLICALMALMVWSTPAEAQTEKFDKYFTGRTLRIDCIREGDALSDSVWVERWIDRCSDWHGSRTQLIDPFDNGDYRVEMRNAKSGEILYSRGFSNLYREYKDTPEARTQRKRFEETLLLPMPKKKVHIALMKRNEAMQMVDQTVILFNPKKQELEYNYRLGERIALELHGPAEKKVDVVIVAQGYADPDDVKLSIDFYRMKEILFGKEPFASHREDFNVYGVYGDVDAQFNTFGIDRYLMTQSLHKLHDKIGTTPCDHIIIMVNSEKYGGGAIYNFYAVSSMHPMASNVLPHEFGHSFGGLADEYVDEDLSYNQLHKHDYEPLEPNITNLKDFDRKWKDMLPDGTVVPTPSLTPTPGSEPYSDATGILSSPRGEGSRECGPLGVYEGAGYSAKGVYRPAMHCMMRDYAPFCPVCSKRIEEIFGLYTK